MASECVACGETNLVADPDTNVVVCASCGVVNGAGATEFVHAATFTEEGRLDRSASSIVRHRSDSAYRDNKLATASDTIISIATRLGLSPSRAAEALQMAKSATDGNLATTGSAFLPALAAACALLVARTHRLPLSLAEAAEAAFCPTQSLADLVSRVAAQLALPPIPSFDYAAALDRAVRMSASLARAAADDTVEARVLTQARFLLRCAFKWSLTTGRHPLPLIAALVAFSAQVNGVTSVSVEDIAQDISAGQTTSLRRYKELINALVHVARQLLPWGADVNAKNLLLNAPVLLRLMEMRSQSDPSELFIEGIAPDVAGIVQAHSFLEEDESKYLQVVPSGAEDFDFDNSVQEVKESEDQMISGKCLADAYQNVLKRLAKLQELGHIGKGVNKRKKKWREALELEPWVGSIDDDWRKDILLEELEDIDVGYDAPPPSFTANVELEKQRRARIEAAKRRIDATRNAPAAIANHSQPVARNEDVCPPQKLPRKKRGRMKMDDGNKIMLRDNAAEKRDGSDGSKKRRKRVSLDDIDWEDCIIELLLLHGANEGEIKEGQYRRLLELHVFSAVG